MRFCIGFLFLIANCLTAQAYDSKKMDLKASEKPKELFNAGITEHLDHRLDTNIELTDEFGKPAKLSQFFKGNRPVILSFVYFGCSNICNFHLNGIGEALQKISERPGQDYEFVAVSFDDRENFEIARSKKEKHLKSFSVPGAQEGWHFLTGKKQEVLALANQVGFKYRWSEEIKEWAHASAAIMITSEKKIARYLHGVYFEPKTVSLALTEASQLKISNIVNNIMLFCFKYDPTISKYTIYAFNVMRAGAGVTVLIFILFFGSFWINRRTTKMRRGANS